MYTVIWSDPALDDFADLYVAATPTERERMANGVEALNRRLAIRPAEEGESREEDVRITFTPLFVIRFRVNLMTDTVRVVAIEPYGR